MAEMLNLLRDDHRHVQSIIEELEKTTARATSKRKELLQTLKQELQIHEKVEEKLFYPVMKKDKEANPLIIEAYEEHHLVDELLAKLEDTEFTDESWKAKLTVLKENLLHHIKEEEQEIFPIAREHLGKKRLQEMGEEMRLMKEKEEGGK